MPLRLTFVFFFFFLAETRFLNLTVLRTRLAPKTHEVETMNLFSVLDDGDGEYGA